MQLMFNYFNDVIINIVLKYGKKSLLLVDCCEK